MQSFVNSAEKSPVYSRQSTFEVSQTSMLLDSTASTSNDEGLFIITKSKCEGFEIYAISDFNRSIRMMPKYHINTDKINIETVKVFAVRDRIFFSYIKDQKLLIKSWTFKRQTMVDVTLPPTVQYLKPRLTNAVAGSFYVSEEKYVAWPNEGYKTIVCRFGLDSESYKCIEVNCGGMKEIIGNGDEIFVFNQKFEVYSFNLAGGKRVARGTLTHNGLIKAVVYHGNIYVGNYIRSKCTLFVEQFKKKSNQWATVILTLKSKPQRIFLIDTSIRPWFISNFSSLTSRRLLHFAHMLMQPIIILARRRIICTYSTVRAKCSDTMMLPVSGLLLICRIISIKRYSVCQLARSPAFQTTTNFRKIM